MLQCSLAKAPQVMAWTTYSSRRPGGLGAPGEGGGVLGNMGKSQAAGRTTSWEMCDQQQGTEQAHHVGLLASRTLQHVHHGTGQSTVFFHVVHPV